MSKNENRKEQSIDEVTAKEAIRDMELAKLFFITENGKFHSSVANNYVQKMQKYASYCKREEQERWNQTIVELVGLAGSVNASAILLELANYEDAANIMEKLATGADWLEIKEFVKEQGHTGGTISSVGQIMLHFSPVGIKFVDEVVGKKWRNLLSCLNEEYQVQKTAQKKRKLVLENGKH